jgi:hypothetical protein
LASTDSRKMPLRIAMKTIGIQANEYFSITPFSLILTSGYASKLKSFQHVLSGDRSNWSVFRLIK